MKKTLLAGILLLIGAVLPGAAILVNIYFHPQTTPINYEMIYFAVTCAFTSLTPALTLALIFIFGNINKMNWAFYASIIAHYIITLIIYSEGLGNEPMGLVLIPIMFVAPVSFIGGIVGFISYLVWERIAAKPMK